MSDARATKQGARATGCQWCGSTIWLVTTVDGGETVTLDAGRDPHGAWLLESRSGHWRCRRMRAGEPVAADRPRYSAHADTCLARRTRTTDTEGPCRGAGCGKRIHRYGPGGSTLCSDCAAALEQWRAAAPTRRLTPPRLTERV